MIYLLSSLAKHHIYLYNISKLTLQNDKVIITIRLIINQIYIC